MLGTLITRHIRLSYGEDVCRHASGNALGDAYAARAWPKARPGDSVRALADRLTEGVDSPRDQALRLYRHVATEIRYVAAAVRECALQVPACAK